MKEIIGWIEKLLVGGARLENVKIIIKSFADDEAEIESK